MIPNTNLSAIQTTSTVFDLSSQHLRYLELLPYIPSYSNTCLYQGPQTSLPSPPLQFHVSSDFMLQLCRLDAWTFQFKCISCLSFTSRCAWRSLTDCRRRCSSSSAARSLTETFGSSEFFALDSSTLDSFSWCCSDWLASAASRIESSSLFMCYKFTAKNGGNQGKYEKRVKTKLTSQLTKQIIQLERCCIPTKMVAWQPVWLSITLIENCWI